MTYAKLIDHTTISTNPPRSAVIDGAQVVGELPEPYLNSQGWYRLGNTPAPDTEDGYHLEPRYAYDDAENPTRIVQSWVEVQDPPAPPRVFSRLKLKLVLARQGLLQQFLAALQNIELIEGSGYMASEAFGDAVTLSEDFEGFGAAVAAIKTALGVTDEQVEEILAESVAQ